MTRATSRRTTPGSAGRALAEAVAADGTRLVGTRTHLVLGEYPIAWEDVQSADWDQDTSLLRVAEVGTWGEQRPVHELVLEEPGRLLELVRERVTASIVLQRHVPIRGRRGVFVIARRSPVGDAPLRWVYEFQEGIDPDDPQVRALAQLALEQARDEVGLP